MSTQVQQLKLIAEMNKEVKAVRRMLAQVETQQVSLLRSLLQRQGRNGNSAPSPATLHVVPLRQEKSGDEYIEELIR